MKAEIIDHHYTHNNYSEMSSISIDRVSLRHFPNSPHIAVLSLYTSQNRVTEKDQSKRGTLSLLSPWRKFSPFSSRFSASHLPLGSAADKLGNLPWEANEPRVELWRSGRTFSKPLFDKKRGWRDSSLIVWVIGGMSFEIGDYRFSIFNFENTRFSQPCLDRV